MKLYCSSTFSNSSTRKTFHGFLWFGKATIALESCHHNKKGLFLVEGYLKAAGQVQGIGHAECEKWRLMLSLVRFLEQ